MSTQLRRLRNRRKRMEELERLIESPYQTDRNKELFRQELANEQREMQRFYH